MCPPIVCSNSLQPVIDRLVTKSRQICLKSRSIPPQGETGSHPYDTRPQFVTGRQSHLPPSFTDVHPFLTRYAERIRLTSPSQVAGLAVSTSDNHRVTGDRVVQTPAVNQPPDTWLPDIYRFNSAGVGIDERYTFASAQPTPFIPSSPRVTEDVIFNFDHGALTADLEETSYMAWF